MYRSDIISHQAAKKIDRSRDDPYTVKCRCLDMRLWWIGGKMAISYNKLEITN